jgi:hypothetical protein
MRWLFSIALSKPVGTSGACRSRHGQAENTISCDRIKASFHLLVRERPSLAELVINECKRWKDWSLAPKLMELYAGGNQPWNNSLILEYLSARPLASAKDFLNRASTDKPTAQKPAAP